MQDMIMGSVEIDPVLSHDFTDCFVPCSPHAVIAPLQAFWKLRPYLLELRRLVHSREDVSLKLC